MTTRRYVVSGQVQGVGFRWFVARHARALRLTGFARNLPDGSVEVVAAGADADTPAFEQLEALLRTGPASARVSGVVSEAWPDAALPPASFDIR